MAHKKNTAEKKGSQPYTIEDAMKITDDVIKMSKEKEYHPGAFVHGLILTLEYVQFSFDIPQQQIANIKRDCRRYVQEIANLSKQNKTP